MRLAALLMLALAPALGAAGPPDRLDVPYAEPKAAARSLDVYAPAGDKGGRPVLVWVHGGGWEQGDKKAVGVKPRAFTDRGYVFVSVNYRLLPGATIGEMAGDVAKAIRWARDHAGESGGDPDRLAVAGHSAGAQLAALVCTDPRYLKAEGLSLSTVKACAPVDGDTYDVPLQIATVEQRRKDIYRRKFGDAEGQKDLSPVMHAAKGQGSPPPFLILHVADHPETQLQSRRLVKALQGAGGAARAYPAAGKTHTTMDTELGAPGDKPTGELFEFLADALKK